jgi:hypothetical protein
MKMTKEHCFINTWKFVKDFLQQFLLLLFAKMRHNVPPNHKVLECCHGGLALQWWTAMKQETPGFPPIFVFFLPL